MHGAVAIRQRRFGVPWQQTLHAPAAAGAVRFSGQSAVASVGLNEFDPGPDDTTTQGETSTAGTSVGLSRELANARPATDTVASAASPNITSRRLGGPGVAAVRLVV